MKVIKTKFKDLKIIKSKIYKDPRGTLREIYRKKLLKENLVFDYYTTSKKNVIRGFHFQIKNQQAKMVSVLRGKIIDICIDLRKGSKTFGKSFKIVISDKNKKSIYIPRGFAHGFLGLDKENIVLYSCSNYRHKKGEQTILWNDADLKINWGIKKPILSEKDKYAQTLKQFLNK